MPLPNEKNSRKFREPSWKRLHFSLCFFLHLVGLDPPITMKINRVKTSTGQWQNSSVPLSHNSWLYFNCIQQLPGLAFKGSLSKECSSQIHKGLLPIQVALEDDQLKKKKKASEANFENFLLTQFQHTIKSFLCGYTQ